MRSSGICALAVYLPDGIRTNAWWGETELPPHTARQTHSTPVSSPGMIKNNPYDAAMNPYLEDPFWGSVERRVVTNGQGSVELGREAARRVLAAAKISPQEVDCLISVSMFPDRIGSGDAAYLAQALGTGGGAFNMEAACCGSMSALLTACALVQAGLKEKVLVVAVSRLSRAVDANDVTLRLCGDAAAAFVVAPVEDGYGLLAAQSLHTGQTCGTWLADAVEDHAKAVSDQQKIQLCFDPSVSHVLRATAEPYLVATTQAALTKARLAIDDIDITVVNTPTAWHAEFSAHALGLAPQRVMNSFPQVANIGPVLIPYNLHIAATEGRLKPGDRVLLYGYGGQAEACAAVLRWPDVILAPCIENAAVIEPTPSQ